MLYHLISMRLRLMRAPTTMSAPPVAHGGMDAIMGAKKMLRKKEKPQRTAVKPVRAPASIPEPDSMYEVTGVRPKMLPKIVASASTEKANLERGKSPFGLATPINLVSAKRVPYRYKYTHGERHDEKADRLAYTRTGGNNQRVAHANFGSSMYTYTLTY
jgi:hypothetical protein